MTTHTLNNGTVVESSDRKSNRSGYTGAALSVAWTLNEEKPFIAACGNPSDPVIKSQLRHQDRTSWHGGHYADAREAAYVVAKFKEDPIAVDREIGASGEWDNFPADLYSLPPGLAIADAVDILRSARIKAKVKAKKTVTIQLDPSIPAQGNLGKFFKRDQIVPIAKSLGGPDQFQASLVGKTVAQFAAENNLSF